MTTGEYLLAHSPLPSGTALAHLLALQTGTGPGGTVFVSKLFVSTETKQISLTRRAAQHHVVETERSGEAGVFDGAHVFLPQKKVFVLHGQQEVIATLKPERKSVFSAPSHSNITN